MNLYKLFLLKYWKKTIKNKPIIVIISIILEDSGFKNIVHNVLRHENEWWITQYYLIMLS